MKYPWFRFYDEVVDDPKVQRLPDRLFKFWVNLMCIANKHNHTLGTLPLIDDVAFRLRISTQKTELLIQELVSAGLLEWDSSAYRCHNWEGRQFKSDVSTERVRKHREQERNVSETVSSAVVDTDTEQIYIQKNPPIVPLLQKRKSGPTEPPNEFELTEDMREWANAQGFDNATVERETSAMLDYFRGHGKRRHDWVATWRNWFRTAKKLNGATNGKQSKFESSAEARQRRSEESTARVLASLERSRGNVPC